MSRAGRRTRRVRPAVGVGAGTVVHRPAALPLPALGRVDLQGEAAAGQGGHGARSWGQAGALAPWCGAASTSAPRARSHRAPHPSSYLREGVALAECVLEPLRVGARPQVGGRPLRRGARTRARKALALQHLLLHAVCRHGAADGACSRCTRGRAQEAACVRAAGQVGGGAHARCWAHKVWRAPPTKQFRPGNSSKAAARWNAHPSERTATKLKQP